MDGCVCCHRRSRRHLHEHLRRQRQRRARLSSICPTPRRWLSPLSLMRTIFSSLARVGVLAAHGVALPHTVLPRGSVLFGTGPCQISCAVRVWLTLSSQRTCTCMHTCTHACSDRLPHSWSTLCAAPRSSVLLICTKRRRSRCASRRASCSYHVAHIQCVCVCVCVYIYTI